MKISQKLKAQLQELQKVAEAVADELDQAYDTYYAMEVDASFLVDVCEYQDKVCVDLRDRYDALTGAIQQTQKILDSLEAYTTYQGFHEELNLVEV